MAKLQSAELRRHAQMNGEMPHEFLLRVSQGEAFNEMIEEPDMPGIYRKVKRYPTFSERVAAAKDAAPYWAPKLSIQKVDTSPLANIRNMSDDELKERLAMLLVRLESSEVVEGELKEPERLVGGR